MNKAIHELLQEDVNPNDGKLTLDPIKSMALIKWVKTVEDSLKNQEQVLERIIDLKELMDEMSKID